MFGPTKLFHMARPYTPERAYRWSVLPLGIFSIVSGIVLPASAVLMPAEQILVPPFAEPWLRRVALGGISILCLPIGVGLCLRSKVAWWAFFAWLMAGTAWHIFIGITDPRFPEFAFLSPAFNIPLAVGIYVATKPVFTLAQREHGGKAESPPGGSEGIRRAKRS